MQQFREFKRVAVWILMLSITYPACALADNRSSATLTAEFDNSGFVLGFHSGGGKLVLNDGSEYAFSLDGYSLGGIGFADSTASGQVYNLKAPSDLSGEYSAHGKGAAFGSGSGTASLRNSATGVVITLTAVQTGVRLGFGFGSVTFKLGKMLKRPRKPPAVVSKPKPPPPQIKAPKRYSLEFGFDKSRVNLAMGRRLNSIVADWKGKSVVFRVSGHADMVGLNRYNQKLSVDRANAVKRAMIERGVSAARITAIGVGRSQLAVPTPPGKRLRANRRVVITIESKI